MGVVALIVFFMLRLSGDPAAILAGDTASSEQVERIRVSLGLTKPLYEQFFGWIIQLLRFDLGTSLFTGLPVTTLIAQRIEPTAMLALSTRVVPSGACSFKLCTATRRRSSTAKAAVGSVSGSTMANSSPP